MTLGGRNLAERLALVVVTDPRCGPGRELVEVVRSALGGGAPAIQLRMKDATARETVALARRLREETARSGALLFLNDRVDLALVAGADGAHLGDDDLPVEAARRIVPAGFILGSSVDTAEEAERAVRAGADYLGVGPVYGTLSKDDAGPPVGLERVRSVRAAAGPVPIVGIGGIDEENAQAVTAAGGDGVAVIRAVMQARDPGVAAARLLEAVRRGVRAL